MSVIAIENAEQYTKLVSSNQISVVLFSAAWAEQCGQIATVMLKLAQIYDKLQFLDVPAEELSAVSMKHSIEAVPTVIFFRNNTAIDRIDGVDIPALTEKCLALNGAAAASATPKQSLDDRLKALINKASLMIFMKGDRDTPRCGFSKELIRLMNETSLPYETFDILSDEEVRQGLKTYSDWPTYPQVYVKGELIGGLDIIKELIANNELVAALNG